MKRFCFCLFFWLVICTNLLYSYPFYSEEGGNLANMNVVPVQGIENPVSAWEECYRNISCPVTDVDGNVYFTTGNKLISLSPEGNRRWEKTIDKRVQFSPMVIGVGNWEYGVIICTDNVIYSFSQFGEQLWSHSIKGNIIFRPLENGNGLYFFSKFKGISELNCISQYTGESYSWWEPYTTLDLITQTPVMNDGPDVMYFVGKYKDSKTYFLRAFNVSMGKLGDADYTFNEKIICRPTLDYNRDYIWVAFPSGRFQGIWDMDCGMFQLKYVGKINGEIVGFATTTTYLYLTSINGEIYKFFPTTKKELEPEWIFATDGWIINSPTVIGGGIYVSSIDIRRDKSSVFFISPSGEIIWKEGIRGCILTPIVPINDAIYFGGRKEIKSIIDFISILIK